MGVSGLWDIISPAEKKYSLEELALDRTARCNKNLRIAIDISIWNFQAQHVVAGKNAGLRTIFYRCCRLYALGIRPVFVFDGDQRPAYKRRQHIDTSVSNRVEHHLLSALVKLFGFAVWNAAGEAEAECAVLQRLGYVDIVFTTDVDVLLFGGQRVARNWPGTDYEPISCVDSEWIEQTTSLDRSDMILMALLSGSDYDSGVNKLGIQLSLAMANLKYHRPVFDILQTTMDINTYNTTMENRRIPHYKDDHYSTQLDEMIDKLQHELNTNQSGILRRRHQTVDLKSLIENEQFTKLAKDWIHPKTAILDPSNTEAAKALNVLLNDEHVTPEFISLASFCQTQFDWSKTTTMEKFAKKLYPGYMLHRTATRHGISSIRCSGRSTTKHHQQATRRQRMHPYFNKYYRSENLFYSDENQPPQHQATDLYRIHLTEDLRKTKHGIRSQKLSRCRVEWHYQSLVEFLSMVETELIDGLGTDADSSQATTNNFDSQANDPIDEPQDNTYGILSGRLETIIDQSNGSDNDDCIDLTVPQTSLPAPAIGPPLLTIPGKQPVPQIQLSPKPSKLPQPRSTKENDYTWIYQYCDPKKCCRQWIGSNLIQKVYPKMMDEFTKTQQAKKNKRTPNTMDSTQKRLDNFFTPVHDTSLTSSNGFEGDSKQIDITTNNHHTTTTYRNQHQRHLHSDQSLIVPIRRHRIID